MTGLPRSESFFSISSTTSEGGVQERERLGEQAQTMDRYELSGMETTTLSRALQQVPAQNLFGHNDVPFIGTVASQAGACTVALPSSQDSQTFRRPVDNQVAQDVVGGFSRMEIGHPQAMDQGEAGASGTRGAEPSTSQAAGANPDAASTSQATSQAPTSYAQVVASMGVRQRPDFEPFEFTVPATPSEPGPAGRATPNLFLGSVPSLATNISETLPLFPPSLLNQDGNLPAQRLSSFRDRLFPNENLRSCQELYSIGSGII
jgi:hypothetical protein